jgi:hypothetical protein
MAVWRRTSLVLITVLTAAAPQTGRPGARKEPFRFALGPPHSGRSGEELWDVTVRPAGLRDSLPPAFELGIAPPGRSAPAGALLRVVIRRGDRRGMTFLLVMLGGAFGPPASSSSGELTALAIEPRDSIPLAVTTTRSSADGAWTGRATLPNGGRFELSIDSANRRGDFRSIGDAEDRKVLLGLAALTASHP